MLYMSEDFQQAIKAQSRNLRSRVTIAYDYPFLNLTSVNSTAENADSDREKAFDGIGLSDYYNDGVFRGFQSENESDGSGDISATLEFGFTAQTISRMTVKGAEGEYPVDFSVKAERQLIFNESNLTPSGTAGAITDLIPVVQGETLFYPNAAFSGYNFFTTIFLYDASEQLVGKVVSSQVTGTYVIPQDGFVTILWEEQGNVPWPFWLSSLETQIDLFVSEDVTNNELIKYTYEFPAAQYDRIELVIDKWSEPGSTAKISAFSFRRTETFSGEDIIKMDITEEIEPQGGTVFGTAIAKQAEIKLSNFRNEFRNDAFVANRVFYPEIGIDTSRISKNETFDVNEDKDLEVKESFTEETGTTWELEETKELTVEPVEQGDYKIINNTIFATREVIPEKFEYAPMGIYYVNDWRLTDDRYFLKIKGLDAIGYLLTQPYECAVETVVNRVYEIWIEDLVTQTLPTYNYTQDDSDFSHDLKFRYGPFATSQILELIGRLNTRQVLNQYNYLSAMALAVTIGVPIIQTGALYYLTTSKYKTEIISLLKANVMPTVFEPNTVIDANKYYTAKNYRNDANLYNSFKVVAADNSTSENDVPARVQKEGKRQIVFNDIVFVRNQDDANQATQYIDNLYQEQQSEVETRWRGNPSLELGDNIDVQIARRGFPVKTLEAESNKGYLVANHYKFTGGLQCTSRVKVLKTEEVMG